MHFPLTPYRYPSRVLTLTLVLGACVPAWADGNEAERSSCVGLPTQTQLKAALTQARQASNGGFNLDMWGSVVNRDGVVCAVAYTGSNRSAQWPGSRVKSRNRRSQPLPQNCPSRS